MYAEEQSRRSPATEHRKVYDAVAGNRVLNFICSGALEGSLLVTLPYRCYMYAHLTLC